jgi:hypothetical protein
MNLLISLMSNTFATDTAHGRQIWWFEFAALVLRYEARLSDKAKQKYRCGTFIGKGRHAQHDVVWYDVKYKNARESQGVRKWRKNIIKNEATKDFIKGRFSELQEKFQHIEDQLTKLTKNKSKHKQKKPAVAETAKEEERKHPLPPVKEEKARSRREAREQQRRTRADATETEPSAELDAGIVDRAAAQIP